MRALCDVHSYVNVYSCTGQQRGAALPYAFAVVFGDQRWLSISRVALT
jgi:hypothetical protein